MKVSMRRLMALAMAGTMTLMAGCSQASSSATGSSDTQSASGESGAEKTASGDKTVIEYWHCNAETQGGLVVDDLVKKFNEENDHIEVVAKYNPDMYKGLMQNLQAEAATGNRRLFRLAGHFWIISPITLTMWHRRMRLINSTARMQIS